MSGAVLTRAEAKARGLARYFTGEKCLNGHTAERLTSSKRCLECDRIGKLEKRKAEPDQVREADRAYYKANAEKKREAANQAYRKRKAQAEHRVP